MQRCWQLALVLVLASPAGALLVYAPSLLPVKYLPHSGCMPARTLGPKCPRARGRTPFLRGVDKGNGGGDVDAPSVLSGIGVLGSVSAVLVLWSEASVAMTRCGPSSMPDWLERSAYLSIFPLIAASLLARIIAGKSLTEILCARLSGSNPPERSTMGSALSLMSVAEYLSSVVLLGAVVVLAVQIGNGDALAEGAGLSGIDVNRCRLLLE